MELLKQIDETISFNEKNIRVIGTYQEPWFVAKDICGILELKNITEAIKILPENWRGLKVLSTFGGDQNMSIINEAGLYRLIMRSNKPIAQKFQEVVCADILPSLRKKGEYKIQSIIDKNKALEEEKLRIEQENLILEHKLQKEKEIVKEKNKDLMVSNIELYSLSRTHNKILRRRKRTAYDIGNVVYIISNEAFTSFYGNKYYKIGKATQGSNEDRSAFTDRLSSYNTGTPKSYTVHYICYIEQNDLLEKMLKAKFRKNLDQCNKEEWLMNTNLETIITFIRQECKNMELPFEEKIYNITEDINPVHYEKEDGENIDSEDEDDNDAFDKNEIKETPKDDIKMYSLPPKKQICQKKSVYEIGNVIYIISHDAFTYHYGKSYYKIGIATQYNDEHRIDFVNRISNCYNYAPTDYTVHYVCYVEQNDLIEKMTKLKFKEEWITNTKLETIISFISQSCKNIQIPFEEIIYTNKKYNQIIKYIDDKIKEEIVTENKIEEETKKEDEDEITIDIVKQYINDLFKLQGFCRKLKISQRGVCADLSDRIIHFINTGEEKPYKTLIELQDLCKEYGLSCRGNKDELEKKIQHYLTTGNKILDEENIMTPVPLEEMSMEQTYILTNIHKFTAEQLVGICNFYKLGGKDSNDVLKQKIKDYFEKGVKYSDRRKDVYQYDNTGKFIKHYNSITEAKTELDICKNAIAKALNANYMINNFIFRNINVVFHENDLTEINKNSVKFKRQLVKADHDKIKELFNNGETKEKLMKTYSVSKTQINRIIKS
jgi:anti-repressor protein